MNIYMYIYMYVCVYFYIHIYIYYAFNRFANRQSIRKYSIDLQIGSQYSAFAQSFRHPVV